MPPHSLIKTRQLAALRTAEQQLMKECGNFVVQHHALPRARDGVELITHKWYYFSAPEMRIYGPFNSRFEACVAFTKSGL
jgi:hypothetical protein